MLQSLSSLQAILMVIRHPRAPSFHVTPKGEHLDEDTISHLVGLVLATVQDPGRYQLQRCPG
jgi:hypothetical protein